MSNPFRHKTWHKPRSYFYYMGIPAVIGRLTDDDIADFYKRYACEGYAKQVFGDICRTEHKTPAEVLSILHSRGLASKLKEEDITTVSYVKFSPELRAQVISDKAAGMKYAEIADKNGITVNQVSNILAVNSAKKKMKAEAERIEKFVEELTVPKPVPAPASAGEINMFAALLALQEFAENELARGSKSFSYIETSMFKDKYATVRFEFDGGEYVLNLDKALVKRDET